jgi:hypothetical protein
MIFLQGLDKRFAGHQHFKHRAEIAGHQQYRIEEFNKIRTWCWETWGAGCERDSQVAYHFNSQWAWHVTGNSLDGPCFIYLIDDQALSLFCLKWI